MNNITLHKGSPKVPVQLERGKDWFFSRSPPETKTFEWGVTRNVISLLWVLFGDCLPRSADFKQRSCDC